MLPASTIPILTYDNDPLAVHFQTIVRNSKIGGAWGQEERQGMMPIEENRPFHIIIANESDAFHVRYVEIQGGAGFNPKLRTVSSQ